MKALIKILINTAIGVILIIVWIHFVDLDKLISVLKKANLWFTFLLFVLIAASFFLRSLRFKILLAKQKLPLLDLVKITYLSQFLSFFIPIRAGEIAKSVFLVTQFKLPLGKSIIWVLIDRFVDFWVNLFLISILILIVPTNLNKNYAFITFSVLGVFTVLTLLIIKNQSLAKKLASLVSNLLVFQKLKSTFILTSATVIDGFEILQTSLYRMIAILSLSILAALLDGLTWYIVLTSLGVKFGFLGSLLGNLLTALTFILPAAPGYVGSAEAAGLAVFSGILRLDPNVSSAATVITHLVSALSLSILGIGSLYLLKFDLSLVWKKILKKD